MFISDHNNIKASDVKDENLVDVETCGICGAKDFKKLIVYSKSPQIHFVKCGNCGAVTYDKILNQEAIDNLYNSDAQYYKDDESKESGGNITFYGSKRFAKHLLKKFKTNKDNDFRILDFGGGDGELAYAVARELYRKYRYSHSDIMVVDYTNELYNTKNRKVSMYHSDSLFSNEVMEIGGISGNEQRNANGGYDIIIASGVIEHIPSPKEDLNQLFDLLKLGGIIYFRTPYIYPLRRDLQRFGVEYDTLYPAHIWDLGGNWWANLPQHVGYKGSISIISSRPSIVEKSFGSHFFIALASYVLKAPWFICHLWPYVGGWEAVYKKGK